MLSRSMRVSPGVRAAAVLWGVAVICGITAAAVHQGGTAQTITSACLWFAFSASALTHLILSHRRHGEKYRSGVAAKVLSGYASLCIGLSFAAGWGGPPGSLSKLLLVLQVLLFCLAAYSLWSAVRAIVRGR